MPAHHAVSHKQFGEPDTWGYERYPEGHQYHLIEESLKVGSWGTEGGALTGTTRYDTWRRDPPRSEGSQQLSLF